MFLLQSNASSEVQLMLISRPLQCEKNTQLTIITVEIKLGLFSSYRKIPIYLKRSSCFGGNLTRGTMEHGKNLAGEIFVVRKIFSY